MGAKKKKKHILIVDDQREVRDVLSSGVQTLGPEFTVVPVPSGEEAVLELALRDFDLLVTDVRLPGISGLEVLRRVRETRPDLKVILITGILDPVIRRNVVDAGADAFFLKPIDVSDFLDAVERCLGLVDEDMPVSNLLQAEDDDIPSENLSERLSALRKELDAFSTILLDENGRIVAQAGELPDNETAESRLFPDLLTGFSASIRISRYLGSSRPEVLSYFGGTKYAIFFAPVSLSHALLVAVNAVQMDEQISKTTQSVYKALYDLQTILENMGVLVRADERLAIEVELPQEDEDTIEEDIEQAPILDAIFENVSANAEQDPDAFWDSLVDDTAKEALNADVLSYEQALQLGLAPEDDDSKNG